MSGRRLLAALCATLLVAGWSASGAAGADPPDLDARAWALIDARSGALLASNDPSRRLSIASTTKLMTAYVALKELPLSKVVRAAPYGGSYEESLLELRPGQRISVRDLLYGLILRSGNDAAYDLAVAASGSEARFVRQMNQRAAALGLADTHYANPIGLDEAGNYSSAYDLVALARRLLDIPVFAKIAASRQAVLRSVRPRRRIVTRNDLLLQEPWATGVKTGFTLGAGYVLVGAGRSNGTELISAVLGTPSEEARDGESERLLEYGFSLYRKRTPVRAGKILAEPSIRYTDDELPLRASRRVVVGLRRGQRLRVAIRAPQEVEGPVRRGAVLGRATVLVDGRRAATVPLRAGRAVAEASAFDRVRSMVTGNLGWFALALFGILVGAVLLWRRLRRGTRREDGVMSREQRRAMRERRREGGGAG
ncbi:MAG TPA: D-alanyl-D-alanine carboxypeptidase family protein [Solirubrobacterales bacterium]|nr:D-alanyl-D-alanine carboxypeptidase family protein [Solirubrobacterales bacterium]